MNRDAEGRLASMRESVEQVRRQVAPERESESVSVCVCVCVCVREREREG